MLYRLFSAVVVSPFAGVSLAVPFKEKKTKINLAIYRRGPSRGRFCFFVCFAVVGFVPFFFVSYFYFQVLFFSSLHRPSLRVAQVVYGHRD